MTLEFLFWFSLLFIIYTYLGYPVLLYLWSILTPAKNPATAHFTPPVSVIIAAKNEEANIQRRLENIFQQEYPQDKIEIIVVSDGSRDRTNAIIEEIIERSAASADSERARISLIKLQDSKGKPTALNTGLNASTGEFIIFADARQQFDSKAIQNLAANFADPSIGCVSGELLFYESEDSSIKSEMGLYWKLEKSIRKLESKIGSVAGATGAIYAIRRALYMNLPEETLLDDVLIPMNIVMQGHRTVFESKAQAYDVISKDISQEWRRKVRTLAGNWQFFSIKPELFSPRTNPIWFRFISHKIFRLLVPFLLIILFLSSCLIDKPLFRIALLLQAGFYLLALAAHMSPAFRNTKLIKIIYFFTFLNAASIAGFWLWMKGDLSKAWKNI